MALMFNDDHLMYYHMDVQSVGLAQTYFTHLDYLVVQCWVQATYLSADTINQIGPQTYSLCQVLSGKDGPHASWCPV